MINCSVSLDKRVGKYVIRLMCPVQGEELAKVAPIVTLSIVGISPLLSVATLDAPDRDWETLQLITS